MKKIIIARPHPFIVEKLSGFMKASGYEPLIVSDITELDAINPLEAAGAVISTSLVSDVREPYDVVFERLKKTIPQAPVIFVTMGRFGEIIKNLTRRVEKLLPNSKVLDVSEKTFMNPELGKPDIFVLFTKDELDTETGHKILRNHFK